jgi:hypothetical protein
MRKNESGFLFISHVGESPSPTVHSNIGHENIRSRKLFNTANKKFSGAVVVISPTCDKTDCEIISSKLRSLNGRGPSKVISMSDHEVTYKNKLVEKVPEEVGKMLYNELARK